MAEMRLTMQSILNFLNPTPQQYGVGLTGFLLHGKRVYVPDLQDLRHQVVTLAHTVGHEGVQKTLVRLRGGFYIPGDRTLVQDFVRTCGVCQRNKTPTTQPAGLL
jgi:hypothetical protein